MKKMFRKEIKNRYKTKPSLIKEIFHFLGDMLAFALVLGGAVLGVITIGAIMGAI
jgi:hypothetical protein